MLRALSILVLLATTAAAEEVARVDDKPAAKPVAGEATSPVSPQAGPSRRQRRSPPEALRDKVPR